MRPVTTTTPPLPGCCSHLGKDSNRCLTNLINDRSAKAFKRERDREPGPHTGFLDLGETSSLGPICRVSVGAPSSLQLCGDTQGLLINHQYLLSACSGLIQPTEPARQVRSRPEESDSRAFSSETGEKSKLSLPVPSDPGYNVS